MTAKSFVLFASLLIVIVCQEVRLSMKTIAAPSRIESKYCVGHRADVVSSAFYPASGGVNCRECHERDIRAQTHEAVNRLSMPTVKPTTFY